MDMEVWHGGLSSMEDVFCLAPCVVLRLFRLDLGLTMNEFGKMLDIHSQPAAGRNVSAEVMISRWENGVVEMSAQYRTRIIKLAQDSNWPFSSYASLLLQFEQMTDKIQVSFRLDMSRHGVLSEMASVKEVSTGDMARLMVEEEIDRYQKNLTHTVKKCQITS